MTPSAVSDQFEMYQSSMMWCDDDKSTDILLGRDADGFDVMYINIYQDLKRINGSVRCDAFDGNRRIHNSQS